MAAGRTEAPCRLQNLDCSSVWPACHKQNTHHMLADVNYSAGTPAANEAIKINLGGDAEPMRDA